MIYLAREAKFREQTVLHYTLSELDYWLGQTSGYITELNRRIEAET